MHTFNIPAGLAPDVAATVTERAGRCVNDPRPAFGLRLRAAELRDTSAGMARQLADGSAPGDMAPHWAINAPKFAAAAAVLEAMADALPEPPAPTREHAPFTEWDTREGAARPWAAIERGAADPDEYRGHVLECIAAGQALGLFYNAELWPYAIALMAERYGYPDARLPAIGDGYSRPDGNVQKGIGSHFYMAVSVLRARAERAHNQACSAGLTIGQKFARLRMQDGRTITSATVQSWAHTGAEVKLQGKRGAAVVTLTCSAGALRAMAERAEQHAQRLASDRAHKAERRAA